MAQHVTIILMIVPLILVITTALVPIKLIISIVIALIIFKVAHASMIVMVAHVNIAEIVLIYIPATSVLVQLVILAQLVGKILMNVLATHANMVVLVLTKSIVIRVTVKMDTLTLIVKLTSTNAVAIPALSEHVMTVLTNLIVLVQLAIKETDVKRILSGIKNSTQSIFTEINFKVASARVIECPTVKAVTGTKTLFQSIS